MWKKIFLGNIVVVLIAVGGWRLVVMLFGEIAFKYVMFSGGFIVVVTALFSAIFAKMISRNIEILSDSVEEVSKGNLAVAIALPSPILRDETNQLADSLNRMIVELRGIVVGATASSETLDKLAVEVRKELKEAATASNEIDSEIIRLSESVEREAREITDTAHIINRMAALLGESSSASRDGARTAMLATEAVKNGSEIAAKAVERIHKVFASFEQSSHEVMRFAMRSKQIDKISGVIANISRQTNLLALNASIEAARAGAQGQGFAQVAEEIRKLSANTDRSAERIAALVDEIIKESSDLHSSIEEGISLLSEGRSELSAMMRSLEHVSDRVRENSKVLEPVFNNAAQQLVEADSVLDTISKAQETAKKNTGATEEIKKRAHYQMKAIEKAIEFLSNLAALSASLKTITAKYKV
ncbi:MAG: methyl-accepting chemotaxis protein [Myxococcota bacterium]